MDDGAVGGVAHEAGSQRPDADGGSRAACRPSWLRRSTQNMRCCRRRAHNLTEVDLKAMEETYWLTRTASKPHIQGPGLFGQDGLLPLEGATACFREFGGDTHGLWTRFARSPSLFHFFDCTDASLLFITSSSLFFSALLMIAGGVTVPVLLWLWLSYTTIQAAGQRFYTFTWDTLLLEVGFWAMPLTLPFFCPSFTCVKGSSRSTPEGLGAPSAPTAETAAATPADNSSSGDADAGRPPPTPGDGSASASRKPEKAEAQRPAPEDAGPVGSEGRAVRFLGSPRVQQGLRGLASPARAFFWCCRCLVSPGTPFLPPAWPTPWISVWGYRWLLFRLMFGAGLIKLRADTAWADLSAMKWHYETQPLPNPVAWFMHALPMPMHKFEVLVNHFVELILPFAVLAPWRQLRLFTGCVQILFQVAILFTGNLAFINWLTIVFAVFLFDDRFLMCFFPTSTLNRLQPLLKGCAGRWSIPPSDAAIGWLAAAGDASPRVSEHSEGTQDASTHKRASPNTRGHSLVDGSAHDGGEPAPEGVDSRTGSPQARAVSAGLREGLPWRLRGGPKCTGRSVRRMLALWGCWRIPLFLLCSAVLLASDALLLLLLEKESFAAVPSVVPFRSRAWESAGLVLLALSAAIALGMLTGVQGAPWYPLWGRRPSSAGPGAGQQRPLSLLASVSASASQEDTGSARETSASLRRGAEADSSDAPRDEKTADRERRDAPENAADGGETARLLWRKTEDVGALCFEVIVAGVVVCNLLVIHFRLGPSVGLGVLTGALFALLLFFAHRRCSNAFLVLRVMAEVGLVTLLTLRSIPVVENLLSPQQIMNDTYEPFNLVNSYGLFGFMTKQREELIVQASLPKRIREPCPGMAGAGALGPVQKPTPSSSSITLQLLWARLRISVECAQRQTSLTSVGNPT
ncbi:putative rhoptry protein [Besnoitia besnoiti]|uniref:Putative rhoptry protein n=1 Tax=Besnoitia besnoiti TaxID=94643 RepID=A0A2A9M8Z0_BESBE|nr:putative rhoptry protein [Besnoitia besnoiti]PFH33654.1 putative rhoptry protein [Besnoitia besnoiti]